MHIDVSQQILHVECAVFQSARPSVTIDASDNLVAYVGDDLSIDCIVASMPDGYIHLIPWWKDDNEVDSLGSHVDVKESPFDKDHCRIISTLSIRNLSFEDSGTYSCFAEVADSSWVNDSILLTVTIPTKLEQPNNNAIILKISIPVSVVIVLSVIFVVLGFFYYQHLRQVRLQQALEGYRKRLLPKKG